MTLELPVADISLQKEIPCGVFSRIQVQTNPLGGNIIAWGLQEAFANRGPFYFFVDFGRSGTNEWEPLNTIPIVDGCMFVDPCQRHWDNQIDYFYRVRVLLPNTPDFSTGNCSVFASQPQPANGLWSRTDWLQAREIIRKELLVKTKRSNKTSPGFLLKRRTFGTRAIQTQEFDTGEIQHVKSEIDFGTGFVGGYFPAIDLLVTLEAPWKRAIELDPTVDTRRDIIRTGRAVAYPYVETRDIYHRRDNGERYIVNSVTTVAEIGGIPIIQSLELRLAPVTDIIYKVPLDGGSLSSSSQSSGDSSSSSGAGDGCNWRTGLNTDVSW
jgi:hypothetical protein